MGFYAFLIVILQFVLSSFWVWLGFIILVATIGGVLVQLVNACKRNRKITGQRVGQRWYVQIENATSADVRRAIRSAAHEPEEGREKGNEQEWEERNGALTGGPVQNQQSGD